MAVAAKRLSILAFLALFAAGCGGSATSDESVFQVSVAVIRVPPEYEELRSHFEQRWHREWVDPASGRFRTESSGPVEPGSSEFETSASVCAESACAVADSDGMWSVRVGSRRFLEPWAERSIALEPLRRYVSSGEEPPERFRRAHSRFVFEITVEKVLSRSEADDERLFAIPTKRVISLARELDPGEPPTLPVKAYWFGPRVGEREAAAAIEQRNGGDIRYSVFYPRGPAKSHAYPGLEDYPDDEVQVASQPVDRGLGQTTLEAFERFRSVTIELSTGERATLFPNTDTEANPPNVVTSFAVVTETTLVSASGRFRDRDVRRLAGRLRPL